MVKSVLVTGATGGIGTAMVRAAAGHGCSVLAAGRYGPRLDQLCADVPGAVPVILDLQNPTELPPQLTGLDRLDALVHCAGIAEVATIDETAYGLWQETLTVNVAAAAEVTRALLPALRRATGHVVFINAAPGLRAAPRWSAYVASKAALRELADSLRAEEARHGLRVTTIYPGGTATELLRKVRDQFGRRYEPAECIQPETLASLVLTGVVDVHPGGGHPPPRPALAMPGDAYLSELSVLPTPRPR